MTLCVAITGTYMLTHHRCERPANSVIIEAAVDV